MNNKIKKGLGYFSLFILALATLPLGNILANEKVEPTKFVIEENNLEANGFKIANDQVLTSEDVVKLSNVKSVDNLVDVNSLTVSDDQLANVNQANPNGGLYKVTLSNGQKANITVPVVKEGSLTTTNSKGALIFKNLALSQEANTKEKVLEETGVYSVAFNNGYENNDLVVNFGENEVTIKDSNLGLSKTLEISVNEPNLNDNPEETMPETSTPNDNSGEAAGEDENQVIEYAPQVQKYTINYETERGARFVSTQLAIVGKPVTIPDFELTKEGYTFDGWKYNGHIYTKGQELSTGIPGAFANQNITLSAVWTAKQYQITFIANDDTGSTKATNMPGVLDKTYGVDLTLQSNPTRTGYIFEGWSQNQAGPATIAPDQPITDLSQGDNVSLYAIWTPITYTISFNPGDGGQGTMESVTATFDQPLQLPDNTFTKDGCNFAGWEDANYKQYENEETVINLTEVNHDTVELTATWTDKEQFSILYRPQSDNTMEPISPPKPYTQSGYVGESVTLEPVKFTRVGFTFKGWAEKRNGPVKYQDQEDVMFDNVVDGDQVDLFAVWEPHTYTVTFVGGEGAQGDMEPQQFTYGVLQFLTENAFTKEGYEFAGWTTTEGGTDVDYYDFQSVKNLSPDDGANIKLYAVWEANRYQIAFDRNKGTGSTIPKGTVSNIKKTYDTPATLPKDVYNREGYQFKGWAKTPDAKDAEFQPGDQLTEDLTTGTKTQTLYAVWEANTYTVTFNKGDGAEGDMQPQNFTFDAAQTLTENTFTKPGYSFGGWATTANGNKVYADQQEVSNLTATNQGNIDLYAVWTANQYQITFDKNKGTGSSEVQGSVPDLTKTYDTPIKLPTQTYTRDGYQFLGWDANKEAQTPTYTAGQELSTDLTTDTTPQTLYAIWQANTYTVTFKPNKGNGSSEVTPAEYQQSFTYDAAPTPLTDNKFSREGYIFKGWATTANGQDVEYENAKVVQNLVTTPNGNLDLYAIWTPNNYTISFDANGGVGAPMDDVEATFDNAATIPDSAFTKDGFHFGGWQVGDSDQIIQPGQTGLNLTTDVDGKVVLKAVWIANQYQIQFDKNEGSGSTPVTGNVDNIEKTYQTPIQLPTQTYSRDGYQFKGWAKTPDATTADFQPGSMLNEDLTTTTDVQKLYAVWEANTYTVTFVKGDGANGEMQNQTFTFDQEQALSDNAFTKDGFHFSGWSTQENGTKDYDNSQQVKNLTTDNNGNVKLYAVWEANEYQIIFDKNQDSGKTEVTGTVNPITKVYGTPQNLPTDTYSREGYQFLGWATDKQASVPDYTPGQELSTDLTTTTDPQTLYAVWQANTYTVTFKPNKGSGSTDVTPSNEYTQDFTYGAGPVSLKANEFSRPGYSFGGWSKTENGQTPDYQNQEEVEDLIATQNGNVDLYAIWTPNNYTIGFDANGGVGAAMEKVQATFDVAAEIPNASYTKDGYVFGGWQVGDSDQIIQPGQTGLNLTTDKDGEVILKAVWVANKYQITFDQNKGNGSSEVTGTVNPIEKTYGTPTQLPKETYSRDGYQFKGWAKQADATAADFQPEQELNEDLTTTTDPQTLYAVWEANAYTVTFVKGDGANGQMADQQFKFDESQPLTQNTFTKDGFAFGGWALDANGTKVYNDAQEVKNLTTENNGNVKLYAVWTANKYQITFDQNKGNGSTEVSGTVNPIEKTYDTPIQLPQDAYSRDGYQFLGWATTPDAKDAMYQPGDTLDQDLTTTTDPQTLYAVWTANAYTVNFNGGDGATGQMQPQTFTYDQAQALSANAFTKEGYTFKGWSTQEGGTTVAYTDAQEVNNLTTQNQGVVELYAVWEANTYTVTFVKGAGAEGDMADQTFTYDQAQALSANAFTKEGYTFKGWSTQEGSTTVSYTDSQEVNNLTAQANGNVKLYAVWTANAYTVNFNGGDGATGQMQPQTFTYDQAQALSTNTFTKEGYTFKGWSTQEGGTTVAYTDGQEVNNLTAQNQGVVELYAVWEANTYTVTFVKGDGAEGDMADQTFTYDQAQPLSTNTFTKEGYTFKGWSTQQGGTTVAYTDAQEVNNLTAQANGNVKLYAVWTANAYTVTFKPNKGNGSTEVSPNADYTQAFTYDAGPVALTPNKFSRPGYTFKGWSTVPDPQDAGYEDGELVENLTSVPNGNVDLYAVWAPNKYSVTYIKGDGAEGQMADQAFTFDQAQSLTANAFTKEGYTFKGWSTQQGAVVAEYTDQQQVNNLTTDVDGNVKLYAVWEANTYTVTFKPNKGNGSTEVSPNSEYTQTFTYGAGPVALTPNQFSRPGYTFKGWSTVPDPQDAGYEDGELVENLTSVPNGNVDLYAVWAPNKYTISFDANGGQGQAIDPLAATFDQATTIPQSTFTKPGFTFTGWKVQGTDKIIQPGDTVTDLSTEVDGKVVLVAQWSENTSYTVTYKANGGVGNDIVTTQALGSTLKAADNTFTRPGFVFGGWSQTPDGPATIQPGDDITTLFAQNGELYAVWTQLPQTIGPNGEGITPDNLGWVNAQDTVVHSSQAIADITSMEALIPAMNAQAQYDGQVVTPTVDTADLAKIQAGIVGSYNVTFTVTGPQTRALGPNQASVTRTYTIIDDEQPTPAPQPQPEQAPVVGGQTPTGAAVNLFSVVIAIIASLLLIVVRRNRK